MSSNFYAWIPPLSTFKIQFCWSRNCMFFAMLHFLFIAIVSINTVFYKGTEKEEKGSGWNINRAQWRAALSAHRQPLLFPFSFSFPFIFCISTVHVKCEQWRAAHHRLSPFPPPATALLLLLLLLLLHYPLFEEEDQKHSTMDNNSLSSPPASVVSTASHSSFSSPSPSSSTCFIVHVNSGELLHCSWPDQVRPKPKCPVFGSDPVK